MEAMDRRLDGAVRMPVDLLVQLSHEQGFHDGEHFDADALNLAASGIGLRSAILPDIGQRLRCRFELPDDGGVCETSAEVVWASDAGTAAGEFGVKFDTLEPRVQALIDDWVSTLEGETPRVITPVSTLSPEPRRKAGGAARIHLDGVGSPIDGTIAKHDGRSVQVAQPLPFLSLGKGATLEVGDDTDRRALSHVALVIEDGVPNLVLTLEKLEKLSARSTTKSAPPDLRAPVERTDTISEVDAIAPPEDAEARAASEPDETPDEIAPRHVEPERPRAVAKSREWVTSDIDTPEPEAHDLEARHDDDSVEAPVRASRDLARMREREPARAVRLADGERAEEAPAGPTLQERITPVLVRVVASMRSAWAITIATTGPWARRAGAWLVTAAKAVAAYVREKAPEKLSALVGRAPRRRTTTPPPAAAPALRRGRASEVPAEPAPSPMRGRGRLALAGVMGIVAVSLTAYALSGSSEPAAPELPAVPAVVAPEPVVEASAETPIETGAAIPEAPALMPAPVEAAPEPAAEPAVEVGHLPPPTFPSLGSASAAHSEPSAVVAPVEEAPTLSAPSSSFGADAVENGRISTLRMSQPVTSLVGQADENGFTVTIHGALSLDRAGPIAAANPSVERASILNRGDHCVLTVRFVTGRSPAYRVAIHGQAVEVTIGR
jgi:hypothetical protein